MNKTTQIRHYSDIITSINMNSISIGNSGEYFVAGELERRGFTVAVPMSNVKDFDILAINRENNKQFAIQVKTTTKNNWLLSKKSESLQGDNIIYILVKLNGFDLPEYHIVPSAVVVERIKSSHEVWLNTPGKYGQKHNDNNVRVFEDNSNEFLNRWDILNNKENV